jgi:predicted TIM-barrel fold metal-dependent hydrolase
MPKPSKSPSRRKPSAPAQPGGKSAFPIIDFHAHFGILLRESYPKKPGLTPEMLLEFMDENGIALAVLLPLESPEGGWGYLLTEDAIAARDKYPDRFIAFMDIDPRYPNTAALIDHFVKDCGCRGFGEHVNGLKFDDPLNKIIYAKCDEHGLPLVIGDDVGAYDEAGLPRLEKCLKEFPNVKFCGHGVNFWSAISGDDNRAPDYPKGPITPGGALDRLMSKYENLYCEISATSGYNAMTRDPEYSHGFIKRHWRRITWGTDIVYPGHPIPLIKWLKELDMPQEIREAIAFRNARRLLGIS